MNKQRCPTQQSALYSLLLYTARVGSAAGQGGFNCPIGESIAIFSPRGSQGGPWGPDLATQSSFRCPDAMTELVITGRR